jgi:hypothetical protein
MKTHLSSFILVLLAACTSDELNPNPGRDRNATGADGGTAESTASLDNDGGALRLTCPTKAPFDTTIPGLVDQCSTRVLIAGLDNAVLKLSFDDGATWSDAAIDPAVADISAYSYATGYGLVAAMTRHGIYTSADAKTWTKVTSTDTYNYSGAVAFANGRFATAGTGGSFGSEDGVVWTGYRAGDQYPSGGKAGVATHALGFFDGQWVLAGDASGKAIVRTSKDGLDWTADTDLVTPRTGTYASFAATADHAVILGGCCGMESEGVVANATDSAAWTPTVDKTLGLRFAVSDGTRLVAFTSTTTLASTDGATWTKLGDAPALDDAVFADGVWFGRNAVEFFVSKNAVTWTSALKPSTANYTGSIGFARLLKKL